MDENERRFHRVSSLLAERDFDSAYVEVERIVNSNRHDAFILVKCSALLLTVDHEQRSAEVADLAWDAVPEDDEGRLQLAIALRGLGRVKDSLRLLHLVPSSHPAKVMETARSLLASGDAAGCLRAIPGEGREQSRLRCEALSRLGSHDDAVALAEELFATEGGYLNGSLLIANLLRADRIKDAKRLTERVGKASKDADSFALKAYVLRVSGKTLAAMNNANQALIKEPRHVGALWNLALCLLEKGRTKEAKVIAGAINEVEPASPLAVEILRLSMA